MSFKPTEQQRKVISHHNGHARVLAIAGSGKTTTMVHRIKNLIENHGVNPKKIRVLMFNSSAKKDFKKKIKKMQLYGSPYITTFHGFGNQFIQHSIKIGILHNYEYWIGEREFRVDGLILKIIKKLEKNGEVEKNKIELEDVKTAISLWKGSLISPENAGHRFCPDIVKVYEEFEQKRSELNFLTFDDFIPLTIHLLETIDKCKQIWLNRIEHFIIDEYQDINLSQQKLIEILAGQSANIMVVGDDDQTIYEWRGARPDYILKEFQTTFTSKPHTTYKLDNTFRFGPILAQCAQNSIVLNSTRQTKNIFAHNVSNPTSIDVYHSSGRNIFNTNEVLVKNIKKLVIEDKVLPSEVRVIGRLYSQFTSIESWLVRSKVPYKLEGSIPFFKRREVKILLDYLIVIENLHSKINNKLIKLIKSIINTPNRKISKKKIDKSFGDFSNVTIFDFLKSYSAVDENIINFSSLIIEGYKFLTNWNKNEKRDCSDLISWIYENSELEKHYLNYYGTGEKATNKISTTQGFIEFMNGLKYSPSELVKYINKLDSTRGASPEDLIMLSTVYKTKGLEFDYVVVPDCNEGVMPYISDNQLAVFDRSKPDFIPNLSDSLENERRLFYVAITRAKKMVMIGCETKEKELASRFIEEIMYEETKSVLYPIVNNKELEADWLLKIKKIAGRKSIIENILKYLNVFGKDDLVAQISKMTLGVQESEFKYKRAYPSNLNKHEEKEKSKNPWDDVII